MKKKILVVDDTPENLDAAKAFFANNSDYEFIYAVNREEGEKLLPNCDALITDRRMPFNDLDKGNRKYEQMNGEILLFESFVQNKPGILVSAHGSVLEIFQNPLSLGKEKAEAHFVSEKMDIFLPGETFEEFKNQVLSFTGRPYETGSDSDHDFRTALTSFLHVHAEIKNVPRSIDGLDKTNPTAWELALQKIAEDFSLNEKPTELPKIKIQ